MNTEKRICSKCAFEKSLSDFYIKDTYKGKSRFDKICKTCRSVYKAKKNAENEECALFCEEEDSYSKQMVTEVICLDGDDVNDLLSIILKLKNWSELFNSDSH